MARIAGFKNRTPIAQIETRTKLPGADTRRKIAAAFGVSHVRLLVEAGELTEAEAGLPAPYPAHHDPLKAPLFETLARIELTKEWAEQLAHSFELAERGSAAILHPHRPDPVPARPPARQRGAGTPAR